LEVSSHEKKDGVRVFEKKHLQPTKSAPSQQQQKQNPQTTPTRISLVSNVGNCFDCGVYDSPIDSNLSQEQQETFKSAEGSRSSHNRSIPEEADGDYDEDDDDDPSDILVIQRGDSIAENNAFEDPPIAEDKKTALYYKHKLTNSSNSLNYYLSGITPKFNMAEETAKQESEAFQKKLIDEVLGKDAGDKVSMEKVMMIIWQFRYDKDVIKFMTRFVCKVGEWSWCVYV
jgi:hypothetical protein